MTKLYCIRHAEAEGNVYRRAHGQYNSLLTPNGHAQLQRLARWFRDHPVDVVVASDLFRARTTAKAVADVYGLPVHTDTRLREISLGSWEDRSWGDIAYREGESLSRFNRDRSFVVPGGESYREATGRIQQAVAEICAKHPGQSIVVTAHGCILRYFLESLTDDPIAHLDNASVSLVEVTDGKPELVFAGENGYLGELSTFAGQNWWRVGDNRDSELRYRPVRFPEDEEAALDYGKACWMSVYGTDRGFDAHFFRKSCRESILENPRFIQFVLEEDQIIGFFQMRAGGVLSARYGHIGMVYLEETHRGRGLGIQLVGEAVSVSRAMGKPGVSLRVWENNKCALRLYQKMGFVQMGQEEGLFGTLLHMKLDIHVE